eukprot:TRINITY_DN76260_c0_g1_i1.p1 TRINITY_DN76260_c0_g1~~TRINITY_DN76260_c0_g1_i1.p1  ORF type:complete len:317 (-),score=48.26 TRINITY_DN76260_c0_g1_i1:67-1017(-)
MSKLALVARGAASGRIRARGVPVHRLLVGPGNGIGHAIAFTVRGVATVGTSPPTHSVSCNCILSAQKRSSSDAQTAVEDTEVASAGTKSIETSSMRPPAATSLSSGTPAALVAKKGVNLGKLAGAIASRVRDLGEVAVDAVGPDAVYAGVKAAIIADGYLKEVRAAGERLVILPGRRVEAGKETRYADDAKLVAVTLRLRHMRVPPGDELAHGAPETDMPAASDLAASGSSNTGLLAGRISALLRRQESVVVTGMGPAAAAAALKALITSRSNLADVLGEHESLAGVPSFDKITVASGEERIRLVLRCVRATPRRE